VRISIIATPEAVVQWQQKKIINENSQTKNSKGQYYCTTVCGHVCGAVVYIDFPIVLWCIF
jgi:hypothetical protein